MHDRTSVLWLPTSNERGRMSAAAPKTSRKHGVHNTSHLRESAATTILDLALPRIGVSLVSRVQSRPVGPGGEGVRVRSADVE